MNKSINGAYKAMPHTLWYNRKHFEVPWNKFTMVLKLYLLCTENNLNIKLHVNIKLHGIGNWILVSLRLEAKKICDIIRNHDAHKQIQPSALCSEWKTLLLIVYCQYNTGKFLHFFLQKPGHRNVGFIFFYK